MIVIAVSTLEQKLIVNILKALLCTTTMANRVRVGTHCDLFLNAKPHDVEVYQDIRGSKMIGSAVLCYVIQEEKRLPKIWLKNKTKHFL